MDEKWTEFGVHVPNVRHLSVARSSEGEPVWAQSKLWEEHIPAGFPNLESFTVVGYLVRPTSVVKMFANFKRNGDLALKNVNLKHLNWRLLGQRERATFITLMEELAADPERKVEWDFLEYASFFRMTTVS